MYSYSDFDAAFVQSRVGQFRDQVARRLAGTLSEDEFRPLRLMNGLYLQLHAYMLRIAVPYGTLNPAQLRQLAMIAERWDRGYGHFTTRTNIQFHWARLEDVPDMLAALAEVGMHSIQTSGNCVRNVTADHFAGAAADEIADPRPYAELIRQWSTDHPEFSFLPRKFKIAITAAPADRAASRSHDIALRLRRDADGAPGFEVQVGGGLGRTPMLARVIRPFLPEAQLLAYIEAILATYNAAGRRDNKFKARVKITVFEMGLEAFRDEVEARFAEILPGFAGVDPALFAAIRAAFAPPPLAARDPGPFHAARARDGAFRAFCDTNLAPHRHPDHAIVTVSLKAHGATPGDISADQLRALADIAERWAHGEARVSHEQNVVLPHVARADLPDVWAALKAAGLATANIGLISDIISCPGMDYCSLATARSIPIAQAIALRFRELDLEHAIGPIKIRISGCINACGHHHLGHVGILGLEKGGVESYQVTLGGDGTETAAIGERAGPGLAHDEIVPAVERLIGAYLTLREGPQESFLAAFRRLGPVPFKAALYPAEGRRDAA